ncbi:MAG: TrkA family potassium uptake protein [Actinomycetota bacterium]|nr:TrkA family potassium uptake protein [Actinomycetota bacterium]
MRVVVIGCGRVGSELAVRLTGEGHDVVIVDKNQHAFRRLPSDWGGEAVVGYGIDRDDLERAGIRQAAAVAAVTSGDNTNILVARIARENFEVPHVVARIYDPRRALIYQRLGIPTVATVSWTVDQVVRRLLPEEMLTAWTDPTGAVSMLERTLPERFAGQKLSLLAEPGRFAPVLVTRSGRARLATPDMVGQDGDVVLFSVDGNAFEELTKRLAGEGPG